MCFNNYNNHLLNYGDLLNLYVVDMYAKIETERLLFLRLNQRKLRSESYEHLKDAIQTDNNPINIGKNVILPSTHTGSIRYLQQRSQHTMGYVRKHGNADLFITFTCNPKWNHQKPVHRHDITARVFKQKLKIMMNLYTKHHIFGEVRCYM